MNAHLAADILGMNRARWEVAAMARALSLMSYLNTAEEEARRKAAQWAIRNWRAYRAECSARFEAIHNARVARMLGRRVA